MRSLAIAGIAVVLMTMGSPFTKAQSPLQFEVASIKPNPTGDGTTKLNTLPGGRLVANNVSLKLLIQFAWGVKDDEIAGGPSWLTTEKYDISAKADTPEELKEEELRPLLQSLLADRFQLKVHPETRELTVYSLVVAKNGPKLTAHSGDARASVGTSYDSGTLTMNAAKTSMVLFANALGRQLAHTVIDNTGLQGEFDFKLVWAPAQTAESSSPSLFTALQEQLGLKLEATKRPGEVIVVDSAEKASEN